MATSTPSSSSIPLKMSDIPFECTAGTSIPYRTNVFDHLMRLTETWGFNESMVWHLQSTNQYFATPGQIAGVQPALLMEVAALMMNIPNYTQNIPINDPFGNPIGSLTITNGVITSSSLASGYTASLNAAGDVVVSYTDASGNAASFTVATTPQTVDALMKLDLAAGVDVEIKL